MDRSVSAPAGTVAGGEADVSDDGRASPGPDEQKGSTPGGRGWFGAGLTVGRFFGVPVQLTPSFFVIAALITITLGPLVEARVPSVSHTGAYAVALLFVLLLYGSVLAHELSHSVVSRAFGLPVRRIVIQFLGGVSEIAREPETAGREYLVAIAGPLTSIFLAGVGGAVVAALPAHTVGWFVAVEFTISNGIVAAFNLLPGLPLDGGRVLRAGLWRLLGDKVRGTVVAANVGRALAVPIAVVPIVGELFGYLRSSTIGIIYFLLIALFLYQGATQALAQARVGAVLPTLDIRRLTRRAITIAADVPLAEAVRRAQAAGARALVIVDGRGRPDAVVNEAAVAAMPAERRPWVPVSSLARRIQAPMILRTDADGERLMETLRDHPATEYLVVEPTGAVYGVLAQADVTTALRASRRAGVGATGPARATG
jgi:Zn-dependent protease